MLRKFVINILIVGYMHYIFFPKLNTPIFYINFYHKESIYININHMRASSD